MKLKFKLRKQIINLLKLYKTLSKKTQSLIIILKIFNFSNYYSKYCIAYYITKQN